MTADRDEFTVPGSVLRWLHDAVLTNSHGSALRAVEALREACPELVQSMQGGGA